MPRQEAPLWLTVLASISLLDKATATAANITLIEALPQLAGISRNPNTGLKLSLGGQNFDHCCSWAVHESLDIEDGVVLGLRSPSFIGDSLTSFLKAQYPCGAKYAGTSPSLINIIRYNGLELLANWYGRRQSWRTFGHGSIQLVQGQLPRMATV